jgi:predicted ribosomally synthesized peptide with SipW-like signal peptide
MLAIAFVGALVAGTYGVFHDQVTYSISPEYFT